MLLCPYQGHFYWCGMKPLLSIGQQAIRFNGKSYTFTPTFRNIASIGDPEEIVLNYETLIDPHCDIVAACNISHEVMSCCAESELPHDLLWDVTGSWSGDRVVMKKGKASLIAQILMAADLLFSGMVGSPFKMKEQPNKKRMTEFNASEFVGAAVAHLGMDNGSAWDMTMVDFQIAMKSKFPDLYAPDLPDAAEIDALFGDVEKVMGGK